MFEKFVKPKIKPAHNADRRSMEAALKSKCIPLLRNQGFKGTFPNFYREREGFVALINFQFFSSGGSFCVNLGYADPQRKNVRQSPEAEPKSLRVSATADQHRLGAGDQRDYWFSFGETSYGEIRGRAMGVDEISSSCVELFSTEAERWWADKANQITY